MKAAKTLDGASAKGRGKTRLRVGVTLYIRDENQTLWENGIFQNSFFLLDLLKRSPVVEGCCIVAGGDGDPKAAKELLAFADVDVVTMAEAKDTLDLVIELSAQLDAAWVKSFAEGGGRVIAMRVANDFIIDCERMAFELPPALLISGAPYAEIWTLPAFARTCRSYYETGYRAPVRVMQHLWSPSLVERTVAEKLGGASLHYKPGKTRWSVGIIEPNICSVKTCHIPILASEVAYRLRPGAFDHIRIFNTIPLRDNGIFINFAQATQMVQDGVATFEARFPIYTILGQYADAIVSHHWENAQNYVYYEALYYGYPLIHNSDMLEGCGYRYADFDPQDGGRALIQAKQQHDLNLEAYKADGRRLIATTDPASERNIRSYSEAIWRAYTGDPDGSLPSDLPTIPSAA